MSKHPYTRLVGKKVTNLGAVSIHDMVGEFNGYYGVVVGTELKVITPEWHDAAVTMQREANLCGFVTHRTV